MEHQSGQMPQGHTKAAVIEVILIIGCPRIKTGIICWPAVFEKDCLGGLTYSAIRCPKISDAVKKITEYKGSNITVRSSASN
jgi:hypothetical protein